MDRTTKKTDYQRYAEEPEIARLLAQEELILDVTEQLCEFLEKEGISRVELAKRLNRSKAFVTQLLGGGRNLTLKTLADVVSVLGGKCKIEIVKKQVEEQDCESNQSVIQLPKTIKAFTKKTPRVSVKEIVAGQHLDNEQIDYSLAA